MNKKIGLSLVAVGVSLSLSGCKTLNDISSSYQESLSELSSGVITSQAPSIETYTHPEYGENVRFSSLPLDQAIVRVQGSGEHKVALMMDPVCPYSRNLESNLHKLEDTTAYIFVGPFLQNSPLDVALHQVCQDSNESKLDAYESAMTGNSYPANLRVSRSCRKESISMFNSMLKVVSDLSEGQRATPTGLPVAFLENDITVFGPSVESIRKYREIGR